MARKKKEAPQEPRFDIAVRVSKTEMEEFRQRCQRLNPKLDVSAMTNPAVIYTLCGGTREYKHGGLRKRSGAKPIRIEVQHTLDGPLYITAKSQKAQATETEPQLIWLETPERELIVSHRNFITFPENVDPDANLA